MAWGRARRGTDAQALAINALAPSLTYSFVTRRPFNCTLLLRIYHRSGFSTPNATTLSRRVGDIKASFFSFHLPPSYHQYPFPFSLLRRLSFALSLTNRNATSQNHQGSST